MNAIAIGCLLTALAAGNTLTLDESPAKAEEWGFRPPESATVAINPPAFSWRAEKAADRYALQVARDAAFEDLALDIETEWCAHAPTKTLAPGAYHWRYKARNEEASWSTWSKARSFQVPEHAHPYPKPTPADLDARIPDAHPRLFLRPEEVADFRTLTEGRLAEDWTKLLAEADKLLANPPDTTEPPKYPEDIKVKSGEWKEIWWGNRIRAIAAADAGAALAFVYRLTGDAKYGRAARDITMAVAAWDPKGSTQYMYNDEAAMPLIFLPTRAYTFAHDQFSEEDRVLLRKVMTVRGQDCFDHLNRSQFLWRPYASHSNRAWHKLGELALVFHDEIPEAPRWLDYALTKFYTGYPAWGVNDGGWHEGASYWVSYMQRFILYWGFTSQAILGINPFEKPFFQHTGDYGMYLLPPGAKTGGFGDQAPTLTSERIAPLLGILAAGAQNPYWQGYYEAHGAPGVGGYLGFIVAARGGAITAKPASELPTSAVFRDVGIAALNTDLGDATKNVQVLFKSSPFGRQSHGYNANNAFLLHIKGQPVFICSGRRDVHGSPHHTRWMWDTKSDNAILVNGEGQRKHRADATGAITGFHTSATVDYVAGEAGPAYDNLNRWTRHILFLKPDIIVIHDVLEAPEPSTYQWLLHAPGAFEIGEQRASWNGTPGSAEVRFLYPAGLTVTQHNQFDPPPADWAKFKLDEWHLTAATTDKQARQQFLTLIIVDGSPVNATLDGSEDGLTLKLSRGETDGTLNFSPGGIQGAWSGETYTF